MNKLLTTFRPTCFTILVLMLLLVLQVAFFHSVCSSSYSGSDTVRYKVKLGIGDPVVIHARRSGDIETSGVFNKVIWSGKLLRLCVEKISGVRPYAAADHTLHIGLDQANDTMLGEDKIAIQIKWIVLLLNLMFYYCLAIVVDSVVRRTTGPRWLMGIWVALAFGAFTFSIVCGKAVWGYYLRRPALPSEVKTIARTPAVIPVTTEKDDSGRYRLGIDDEFSLSDCLLRAERDAYYCLEARVLFYLQQRALLPNDPTCELGDLTDLYDLLPETGLLAEPQDGYEQSYLLTGVIVDAVSHNSQRLVFLGARGGAISNDHYPYYEFVFRERDRGQGLTFVQGQRFFYDVAGIEGLEWESLWIALTLGLTAVGLPILMVILIAWIAIQALRPAKTLNLPVSVQEPRQGDTTPSTE